MPVVRDDTPSRTARGVALARSRLARPSSPTGDTAAEARLYEGLIGDFEPSPDARRRHGDFLGSIGVRTAFFDDAVTTTITDGIGQIVILGAGYDCRALRFRTPGARFFEVDHPATQHDKLRRLAEAGASTDDIAFVAADFTQPGLGVALDAAGYDRSARALFLCEGVLRYLPEEWFRALLRTAAEHSAPGSRLAVSISTRPPDLDAAQREDEAERSRRLAESGEPVLTVPERAVALEWLAGAGAGWTIDHVDDIADTAPATRRGRLLVRAHR